MDAWTNLCSPAKLYILFTIALVLFDMYLGNMNRLVHNSMYGVIGAIMLYVLCAANMDFAAWGLLALPVIFFIFLFALIVYDQSFLTVSHHYIEKPTPESCEPSCETQNEEECVMPKKCWTE